MGVDPRLSGNFNVAGARDKKGRQGNYPVAAPFAPPPAPSSDPAPAPPAPLADAPPLANVLAAPVPVAPPVPVAALVTPVVAQEAAPSAEPATAFASQPIANPTVAADDSASEFGSATGTVWDVDRSDGGAAFGVSSLLLGILAIVVALIPSFRFVALPPAGLAIVVAFFGISESGRKFAIGGLIAGALSLGLVFADPGHFFESSGNAMPSQPTTFGKSPATASVKPVETPKQKTTKGQPLVVDKTAKVALAPAARPLTKEEELELEQKLVKERTQAALLKFEQEQKERDRIEQVKQQTLAKKKADEEKAAEIASAKKAEKERVATAVESLVQKLQAGTPEWMHGLEVTAQYHRKKLTPIDVTSSVKKSARGEVIWLSWKDLEHRTPTMQNPDGALRAKLLAPTKMNGVIEAAFLLAPDGKVTYQRITTPGGNTLEAGEIAGTGNRLYGWHVLFSALK